ncbi:hypothetical protein J2T56_001062 [Natronobacillus azotifigens]|uniref:Uncharacterized protein n=1 Tax=Natronobacillus azotifigens TaxID=472978 RepID=A0A9J6RAP0_9BACI|nr:hypothetical protein [Natronobacillus azotifigens]MCZ0702728.1 hypothetical protein [Natronobacillus azotifigens]
MLKAEWLRIYRKKSIYILSIIPFIGVCFWIFERYQNASELSQLSLDSDIAGAGETIENLLLALRPEWIFSQAMGEVFSTIYLFPFVIIGVIWVYDDLNHGILTHVATVHQNRFRYFMIKIFSLSLFFLMTVFLYFFVLATTSFFLPDTLKSEWPQIFSLWNLRAFCIFTFVLLFWSIVGMTITYLSQSAVVGSGILMFYLLFERVFTTVTAYSFQSELLMKMNEYLPWANMNSLIMYASQIKTETSQGFFSSVDPIMFEMTTYMEGMLIPMPIVKPLYVLMIFSVLYSFVFGSVFWMTFQYRIKHS